MIEDCDSASTDAGLGPLKIPSMDHVEIHPAKAVHSVDSLQISQNWLVVLTILKNLSSSMGRMTSHI
jgi:hypothetical protein